MLHSIVPADTQQTDTYFVVAHFHYVLFGGLVFGLFGGFYYWFPKVYGHRMNERLGKLNFWLMLIGFNLTFFPMHFVGLLGMPRRTYRYDTGMGWEGLNQIETIGAFIIALGVLIFLVNVIVVAPARRARRPTTRGTRARSSGRSRRRRPSTTSPRSRRSRRSTTSGTASTPRTTRAGSCACRAAARWRSRIAPATAVAVPVTTRGRRRRPRHPHAVAVVLPADPRRRPAALGYAAVFQQWWLAAVGGCRCCSAPTPGRSSPPTEPERRMTRATTVTEQPAAADAHGGPRRSRPARDRDRRHQHQARDLDVPGVRLPVLRRLHLGLPALPRPAGSEGADGRPRSTTSRSRR